MSETHVDKVTERVKNFLIKKFPLAHKRNLQNHDSLIDSGIIDSQGILDLVAFLESEFGMQVSDEELVRENFQTVEYIVAFVRNKAADNSGLQR